MSVGHRTIVEGDEATLSPEEAGSLPRPVEQRRASGAARIVARELLAKLGVARAAIVRSASGAPRWPQGIVGSLAHDAMVAVAAVASKRDVTALGIDIEPARRLDPDLLDIVLSPAERLRISDDPFGGMLYFLAKEAVYKAVHPLDGKFLEHHEVLVDLKTLKAELRNGRVLDLRFAISTHLVAVAYVAAGEGPTRGKA